MRKEGRGGGGCEAEAARHTEKYALIPHARQSGPQAWAALAHTNYGDGSTQLVVTPPMLVVANRAVVYAEPQ